MTEFHADDFGFFSAQSRRILQCWENGALNGISVFPNGEELVNCLGLLPNTGLSLTVHLNLMQGHCLAEPSSISLLADQNGIFSASFCELLFCPLFGKREQYKQQLKIELSAQIHALLPIFQEKNLPLRIDGHAHWHMIPVVFDALMEVIQDELLPVSYIRIPAEPISIYLKNFFKILPFPPINFVKSLLLCILAKINRNRWKEELRSTEDCVFLGVLLSGCFDFRRMCAVLPDGEALAKKHKCRLELLAHPGSVQEAEDISRVTNENDRRFFTSPARAIEAEGLMHIRKYSF
ncbi:MAG: ChbG/HpnK family deacetylase [Oscillospiraceae bacterium]|nr:ChbG/HpnK family deacetylase [Oscillospiraceae bacterium]